MAQWHSSSESGILRKNKPKDNFDDLLVFGYACKVFKDDEKALYIDQGKHLIPWMGDDKLKIDRYDCRGHLSDVSRYEASREGFDAMRWLGLSESERRLEQLCDKERYHSLHINEEEEEMYKEEELKRNKTNEFQYSYDVPTNPEAISQEGIPTVSELEDDEDYVPPPDLDVPVDIALPKTMKENARIEKTALFVCNQGAQMEILIKAKQADNPQFSFLNQADSLYKFYRHVLMAIKNGRYKIKSNTDKKVERNSESESGDDHYLHPSLVSASTNLEVPLPPIPSVPYKPSANCTYSQLVNRIQGSQAEVPAPDCQKQPEVQPTSTLTYEQQQQYYQYYVTQQYYEYYKQLAQAQQNPEMVDPAKSQLLPPQDIQLDANMQAYIQQMVYAQYLQHQQQHQQQQQQQQNTNPYAQIVSNVNKEYVNPYPSVVPTATAALPEQPDISREPVIYSTNSEEIKTVTRETPTEDAKKSPEETLVTAATKIEEVKKPFQLLAQYGSDTDDNATDDEETTTVTKEETISRPTGDMQVVIDKMASYVAKNGIEFEEIVKGRADPRFEFLQNKHEYHDYYRRKVNELLGVGNGGKEEATIEEEADADVAKKEVASPTKPREKKIIAPVSFSIKKPKEEPQKEIKSALPVEESDEEEETNTPPVSTTPPPPISVVASPAAPSVTTTTAASPLNANFSNTIYKVESQNTIINETAADGDATKVTTKRNGFLDVDDPILEMIDLTDDLEDRKDAKRAEDKIKDKLAAAAREKLSSATRDRALQLERRKKAQAFLRLKSAQTDVNSEPTTERRNSADSDESRSERCKHPPIAKTEEKVKTKIKSEEKVRRKRDRSSIESTRERDRMKKSTSPRKEEKIEILSDGDETKKKKSHKKKRSHKRKHSKSKHESKSRKKRKKRSESSSSHSSKSSVS